MAELVVSKNYPKAAVETALGKWYDDLMQTALRRPKSPEERKAQGGSVLDIQPELSSQQAVAVLLEMEEILGYEPKKRVIRRGGYRSRGEFIKDLSSKIETDFNDHYAMKKPVIAVVEAEKSIHVQL